MQIKTLEDNSHVRRNLTVCQDSRFTCKQNETCCLLSNGSWGCCLHNDVSFCVIIKFKL